MDMRHLRLLSLLEAQRIAWNWVITLLLLVCLVVSVSAEGGRRSVRGVVTDQNDEPLGGAVVHIENTCSLDIRSFITKEDGTYYFYGLNPDIDYLLKAHYHGFWSPTKRLSSFDSRSEAVIDLKVTVRE
jgi:hypothetical protein